MRVAVAGATGVIGRCLVPLLSEAGHEVTGLSRSQGTDLLDPEAVTRAVDKAAPEVVVHLATAIPAQLNPKTMKCDFALTNRLRTEGTGNLLGAARVAGAKRIIVQGLAYCYQPAGAALQGCAARRSPSSPGSGSPGTPGWSRAGTSPPRSKSSTRSPGRCC